MNQKPKFSTSGSLLLENFLWPNSTLSKFLKNIDFLIEKPGHKNIFIGQRMGHKLLVQRMGMGTYLATLMKYWTMSDFKLVSVGSSLASDITDLDSKRKMAQAKMWSWP